MGISLVFQSPESLGEIFAVSFSHPADVLKARWGQVWEAVMVSFNIWKMAIYSELSHHRW